MRSRVGSEWEMQDPTNLGGIPPFPPGIPPQFLPGDREKEAHCRHFAAHSLFPEEKFQENPLGPGYKDSYGRLKLFF